MLPSVGRNRVAWLCASWNRGIWRVLRRKPGWSPLIAAVSVICAITSAVAADAVNDLSLEDLINIKVTSVSKRETTLFDAPAAITVLKQDDLERLGATSVAEALRAVPGMDVARVNSSVWAVTARGFNSQYANKLLVLVDGRSVYTPTFGGVYWDLIDPVLEDLDRIEVIRGPGASLWGANAVNGVINITSKSARETQGGLISTTFGTELQPLVNARYGGQITSNLYYRVYGSYSRRPGFDDRNGPSMDDDWDLGRGGFRLDWEPSQENHVSLSGEYFQGNFGEQVSKTAAVPPTNALLDVDVNNRGGNLVGSWTHTFSEASEFTLQLYYDGYDHHNPYGGGALTVGPAFFSGNAITERRDTGDLDFHHRFAWGTRQEITWGLGFRYTRDDLRSNGSEIIPNPESEDDHLYSGFVQDELTLVADHLFLTAGTKLEHNDFTGWEVQPSARLLWKPGEQHAVWGSISRAVRTPSRVERDIQANLLSFPLPPTGTPAQVSLLGNPELDSETVIAYEVGYRFEPMSRLSFDVAAFYNDYDLIASRPSPNSVFETNPPPAHVLVNPYQYHNGFHGHTHGAEISSQWKPTDWLRLSGSYSWLEVSADSATGPRSTPQQQCNIGAAVNLTHGFELDGVLYYVDRLFTSSGTAPMDVRIPAYFRLDLGITWRLNDRLEVSVWGQNLLDPGHPEFGSFKTSNIAEIPRSVCGKITWRF
jgi:iron complex outermembrane recepter protein